MHAANCTESLLGGAFFGCLQTQPALRLIRQCGGRRAAGEPLRRAAAGQRKHARAGQPAAERAARPDIAAQRDALWRRQRPDTILERQERARAARQARRQARGVHALQRLPGLITRDA